MKLLQGTSSSGPLTVNMQAIPSPIFVEDLKNEIATEMVRFVC
jgi:hypothetical protein